MNKSKLINDIVNRIESNRYYATAVVTNDTVRKEFERNNRLLEEIKSELYLENINEQYDTSHNSQYEKGVKDAWNLAFKIAGSPYYGCYDNKELDEIFDQADSCGVFDNHSYNTALRLVQEYEKKKAESPIIGDVVKVVDNGNSHNVYYGIYLGVHNDTHYIMERDCCAPSCFSIKHYKLIKTGQHVDLEGWNVE